MHVTILSDRAVSPNLAAQDTAVVCSFPQTTVLRDGQVACFYRQGNHAKHSHDGVFVMQRSADQGTTWSAPQLVFDGRPLDPPQTAVSGGLCQTQSGALLATFFVVEGLQPNVYMYGPDGMTLPRRVYRTRSVDMGQSWSRPTEIDTSAYAVAAIAAKPFALPDGQLCLPIEVQTPLGPFGTAGTFSADDGLSVGTIVPFTASTDGQTNLCDAHFTLLQDGRVLMLLWTFLQENEETIDVHRSFSADGGKSWTEPEPIGMLGQIAAPLQLPSGQVIVATTYRQPPEGIRLWSSPDGGLSWETDRPIQMWDPRQHQLVGTPLSQQPGTDTTGSIWAALAGFTFGTPDLVALTDGTALLTYYATLDGITHVRACRFAVH